MNNIAEEPLTPEQREAYSGIQVAALISMPLIKNGEFVGGLTVHSATPRLWTAQEMRLLEETADRTWATAERAKAEEALGKNLSILEKSQEVGHIGSWTVDWDEGRVEASDEAYRIYGLEPGAPIFINDILGMIHPHDLDRYREHLAAIRLDGWLGAIDYRVIRSDGSVRHVHAITARVLRDNQGTIESAFGISQDVTEAKQAEERVQALADENERLYRQQLDIAERLQAAFLHIPSQLGAIRIEHLYRSASEVARLGGDFYDVFQAKGGRIALLMGDVAGHGIEAARAATLAKDVVHAFVHQTLRTDEVLKRTNGLLMEKQLPGHVTLFLGILDPHTGELRYSSAGHPDMLVRRASADVEHLTANSLPLGIFSDAVWKQSAVELQEDDLLVLFTDGVIEARRNGEQFGEKRLDSLLRRKRASAEGLPNFILDRVLTFSEGILQDDLAILTARLTSKPEAASRKKPRQPEAPNPSFPQKSRSYLAGLCQPNQGLPPLARLVARLSSDLGSSELPRFQRPLRSHPHRCRSPHGRPDPLW
jgi:PAS domain S-box-containing protein